MKDKIVEKVVKKYQQRSETGIKKYNTTLERNDLSIIDWITHAQEEAMDLTLYLERLKEDVRELKTELKTIIEENRKELKNER